MKLYPTKEVNLGYHLDNHELKTLWDYGDYLRKLPNYMEETDETIKLQGQIEITQNTEWPSIEAYKKALERREKETRDFLGTHENPFLI